jgi:ribosomal protein S18 acetylase RimI-like enzyme
MCVASGQLPCGVLHFYNRHQTTRESMATAAQSDLNLTLLPLRDTDLGQLEVLFDLQCEEWLRLLRWDYSGPSRLIREVSRARELPGFSVASGGNAIGFAYYTVEGSRCSIGDVYVSPAWRGIGADQSVVEAVLAEVEGLGRIQRIESQCVSSENDAADRLLLERGFSRRERHYMMLDLSAPFLPEPQLAACPEGMTTRAWRSEDFSQAARIIHRSYKGGHDSMINSQYRTEEGCADLLAILTDHIWCGDFLGGVSRVGVGSSGNLIAVLIASRISGGSGHISQISIHPAHQNRGLGRRLMTEAISEFRRLGYKNASLAVTSTNERAHHLYESLGFRSVHVFPVYYCDVRQTV